MSNLQIKSAMAKLLKNLKWILLPVTIITFLLFVDAGTDSNGISSDEEGIMYTAWLFLIINVGLFVFNKKWMNFLDKKL